jgi:predicted NACHT family NTPase
MEQAPSLLEVKRICCEKVRRNYGVVRLLNDQQVKVDHIYVDVYLLNRPNHTVVAGINKLLQNFGSSDAAKNFDRLGFGPRSERHTGLEIANKHDRIMLLGKPGSGKTTFLRHLAVACARKEFQPERIPVLIELRSLTFRQLENLDLLALLGQELRLTDSAQIEHLLDKAGILLLIDGLDEVPELYRQQVQKFVQNFSRIYHDTRIILTCRTQAVASALDGFECVEVADFSPEQVEQFVDNWFAALDSANQNLTADFKRQLRLPEHQTTAELTTTPVLLSLACWIFQDQGVFPAQRVSLYREGLELLLARWDKDRGIHRDCQNETYRKLSWLERKELLGYIAAHKFQKEQYVLFEQREIEHYLTTYLKIEIRESPEILKTIESQHGLIIERSHRVFSFSHLTFQEYLVADWFCERPQYWSEILEHMGKRHWREVFLLMVENLSKAKADDFLLQMQGKNEALLGRSADNTLQHLMQWVQNKAASVQASCHPADVRAFYFSLIRDIGWARILYPGNNIINIDSHWDFSLDESLCNALECAREMSRICDVRRLRSLSKYLKSALDLASSPPNHPPFAKYGLTILSGNKLRHDLKYVCAALPNIDAHERLSFQQWWAAYGCDWTEALRKLMIEHRKIGYDWQLDDDQKQTIQKYCLGNKLLVDCLASNSNISPAVRAEIQSMFLLPPFVFWHTSQNRKQILAPEQSRHSLVDVQESKIVASQPEDVDTYWEELEPVCAKWEDKTPVCASCEFDDLVITTLEEGGLDDFSLGSDLIIE